MFMLLPSKDKSDNKQQKIYIFQKKTLYYYGFAYYFDHSEFLK